MKLTPNQHTKYSGRSRYRMNHPDCTVRPKCVDAAAVVLILGKVDQKS